MDKQKSIDEGPNHSANELRSIFDATHDAIWIVDETQCILQCNRMSEEMFGLPAEEMIGRQCWEVVHATKCPIPECPFPRAAESHKRESMELKAKDRWFEVTVDPIYDANGDLSRAVHIVRDITARRQAEEALRESEERLRLVTKATSEDIWQLDLEGRVTFASEAVHDIFGYTPEESREMGFDAFFLDDEIPRARQAFLNAVSGMKHQLLEFEGRRKDGTQIPIEVVVAPLERNGEIVGVQGIARDITGRRQTEASIQESEERFRLIFDNSTLSIALASADGHVLMCNPALERLFGYSLEEIRVLSFRDFTVPSFLEEEERLLAEVVRGDRDSYEIEKQNIRKDGSTYWVHGTITAIRDESNDIKYLISIAEDITDRRDAELRLQEAQSFNETILNTTPDTIYIYDIVERKNVYSSQSIGSVLGYSVEEIQDMGTEILPRLMHADDFASYVENILPRYATAHDGELIEHEYRMKHRDGSWRWLRSKESIFNRLEDGAPRQILGIVGDITAHKESEQALAASEERYRLLFENIINGFALHEIVLDDSGTPVDYVFLEANAAFERLTGIRRDQLIGKRVTEVLPGIEDDPADWIGRYGEVALSGNETRFEQFSELLERWYSVLAFRPRPNQFATVFDDITERREAEQALQASEQRLRTAGEAAFDLIYEWDAVTDSLEWFGDIDGLLGFEQGEISRHVSAWLALIHPEDRAQMEDAVERHRVSTIPIGYEYRIQQKSGEYRFWNDHALPILDNAGKPVRWVGVCTDITERMVAQLALQENEERFRSITEQMMDMIFLTDSAGMITYISPASRAIFRCDPEEMVGRRFVEFLDPEDVSIALGAFQAAVETGEPTHRIELEMMRKDGELFTGELTGRIYEHEGNSGTIGVIRDVSDRKRAEMEKLEVEAQLRQAQKLESIGTLASGVAHEVNNPLTGIINYAELVKDRVEGDERAVEYTSAIIEEGNRIAAIVRNLLAFSRQDEAPHSLARISDIVEATLSLLRVSLRRHQIELMTQIPEGLPEVRCRSQQIQQVLVNLMNNAQAALNERYAGFDEDKTLGISACEHVDEDGRWLRVSVEDHGTGIPLSVQDRVFDPFFTSKSRDQGTGLGLSVSHGIVQEHGGRLTFKTLEGEGTCFFVDLPLEPDAIA